MRQAPEVPAPLLNDPLFGSQAISPAAKIVTPAARAPRGAPGATLIAAAIEALDLAPLLDLEVRMLSAGQRRRLALGRLVASPRSIWLLDEPLAPLDARRPAPGVERVRDEIENVVRVQVRDHHGADLGVIDVRAQLGEHARTAVEQHGRVGGAPLDEIARAGAVGVLPGG